MKQRMTVVQVLPALEGGGVERGTLEIGKALAEAGHRSIVISGGGRMVGQLIAEGSEHVTWPIGEKSLWTLRLVSRLRRFLQEEKVDILHARSRLPAWIAWLAWRKMDPARRPRFVTTVHGLYTVNWYSAIMTRGERVIAVSETVRQYVFENYHGVNHDSVLVIHRGVDRDVFPYGYKPSTSWMKAWQRDFPSLSGKYVVTLPARITRWKGQEDFVRIIRGLKESGIRVAGLMVGGVDRKKTHFASELNDKIEMAGLKDDVYMLGHRTDLREIMAVSDVVLSLSNDPEAFGRTTIEALSLGTPVCAYAHGGVKEQLDAVFSEGCVDEGDVGSVVDNLVKWERFGAPRVCPDHVFTLENMTTSTLSLYEDLVFL